MAKRKPRPQPTLAPEVLDRFRPRFDAIGPWKIYVADDGTLVEWDTVPAFSNLGFRASLEFEIETESGDRHPDEQMLALWDRFLRGLDRHAEHFRHEMVAVYRESQPHLFEQDEYPPDLSDGDVLKHVRATVRVRRQEYEGAAYHDLDVSFAAGWDGEHAWDFDYDEESDSFGESSKG